MSISPPAALRRGLLVITLALAGCAMGDPGPSDLGTTNQRLSAEDWRVHTHDDDPAAFEQVYELVRERATDAHRVALISPHTAPRIVTAAELDDAVAAGALEGVALPELAVMESAGEGFLVLVDRGEAFTAQAVIVPADAAAEANGALLTIGERHEDGSGSSLMGVSAGARSVSEWVGDAS